MHFPVLSLGLSLLLLILPLGSVGLPPPPPPSHSAQVGSGQSQSSASAEQPASERFSLRPRARIFFPDSVPGQRRGRGRGKLSGGDPKGRPQFQGQFEGVEKWCQERPSDDWIQTVLSLVEEEIQNPPLINFPVDDSFIVFDDKAHESAPPNAVPYDWLQNWLKLNLKPTGTRLDHKISKSGPRQIITLKTVLEEQTRLIYQHLLHAITARIK